MSYRTRHARHAVTDVAIPALSLLRALAATRDDRVRSSHEDRVLNDRGEPVTVHRCTHRDRHVHPHP